MKKTMTALLLALLLPCCALAQETIRIDGTIEAVKTQTILAPHTGLTGDFTVRAGDEMKQGDVLFTIGAKKVYAEDDGVITGIFAQAGDSAAFVQERYGALCYMERDTLYTAQCTTSGSASENEYKIVHVGEKVYVRSDANDKRVGEAIVTSVQGREYTLELTMHHDIRLNERIEVYRDNRYQGSSCIGEGRVQRIDPVGVTAEGYVRAVHVTDGQKVSRGDLLFEMTPDALEGMKGGDGSVRMPADGIVLSVLASSGEQIEKDQPMATVCRREDIRLICPADEEDLPRLETGMQVQVTLDAYRGETLTGTVEKIAGASADEGSAACYDVTIVLEDSDKVRIGMNASIEF